MKDEQKTSCKNGEIYALGEHRLFCGDCMDIPDEFFGEDKIRMILTDPPYGVAYVENKKHLKETVGSELGVGTVIAGDQLRTDEQYAIFTKDWLEQAKKRMASYNTVYIFNGDMMFCSLRAGMKMAGVYYSQLIIWIKNTVVIGRKDYLPQHELIAYGWFGKHKPERGKDRSVLFHPKPSSNKLHPTMKPVGILRKLILNSTKKGEFVYDPFGGSGSTLIACEHTKRKCLMIEMDTNYCSKIIKRWEILTKKQAKKIK